MGAGDILLLHTDGLVDHRNADEDYYPRRLEEKLRDVKHQTAAEIFEAIRRTCWPSARPPTMSRSSSSSGRRGLGATRLGRGRGLTAATR